MLGKCDCGDTTLGAARRDHIFNAICKTRGSQRILRANDAPPAGPDPDLRSADRRLTDTCFAYILQVYGSTESLPADSLQKQVGPPGKPIREGNHP